MQVEIWMVQAIVMRSQAEMGNMLLNNGEKLNCVGVAVFWQKVELVCIESGYLVEEISEQTVEAAAWFLLTAWSKMKEGRNDLKMVLFSKVEAELKDLENSQSVILKK